MTDISLANSTVNLLPERPEDLVAHIDAHCRLYHLSCSGAATWYDFAMQIGHYLRSCGESIASIKAITSAEYPLHEIRPRYSVLCNEKVRKEFAIDTEGWKEAFKKDVSAG